MNLKVGSIVIYGDNKRGIIEGVFEKTVWISGETISKEEIKEKIKDVEIGDILLLEIDGEVLNEVILAEHIEEEIEGEGVHHYFGWDNIENGRITLGQNQPLEYIRVPQAINNILKDTKYKPNNIEIPTREELEEFNQNILDQDLKVGQVVAYADKSIKTDQKGLEKMGITDYYTNNTAGVGVIGSTPRVSEDQIELEISGKTIFIKEDRKSNDLNATIYPIKDKLNKGDVVTYGEDEYGVVFNVEDGGKRLQVYNKCGNTIDFVNATECELLKISETERKLIIELEVLTTGESHYRCERISDECRRAN